MMVSMRRHARPESPRALRRKLYGEAEAEIGSRVFPLPVPAPPPHMPSVGTRRSTRVFVPKASSAAAAANASHDGDSKVRRAGKRLAVPKSSDDWLGDFGGGGSTEPKWWKRGEWEKQYLGKSATFDEPQEVVAAVGELMRKSPDVPEESPEHLIDKKFAIVYERKRQRQLSDVVASSSTSLGEVTCRMDGRFKGLVFARNGRRKRLNVSQSTTVDEDRLNKTRKRGVARGELSVATSTANFVKNIGIAEDLLCSSVRGHVVLLLLVETSCSSSSLRLSRLLTVILRWMRRSTTTLREFATFLLSGSLSSVFSQQGVHILTVSRYADNALFINGLPSCGLCKIYGTRGSVPLLWLEFLALPSYFWSLHVSMLCGSLYLPNFIARYWKGLNTDLFIAANSEGNDSRAIVEAGYLRTGRSGLDVMKRYEHNGNSNMYRLDAQNATILHRSRLNSHRRRRSFSRYHRNRNQSLMNSPAALPTLVHSNLNSSNSLLEVQTTVSPEVTIRPIFIEVPDAYADDLLSCKDDSDASTPLSANGRQRKAAKKSPVEQNKELKSALADVKQNIDSVHCTANVLITDADKCWREEGLEIMLDMLSSQEWCIAVKLKGEVKFVHKPLEMRPCVVNRFTHAYMWAGDDRWKLEFVDRWDWLVFKELHMECRERNLQEASTRMIPVPVYKEVFGYEEDTEATFVRPDLYISMRDDEVQRALLSKIPKYDMDSGDEQWLVKHNSSNPHKEISDVPDISVENFEKIIYAIEKDAYSNVDDVFDKSKALDLYQQFGKREMLSIIYDYWIKKRNKRHTSLVREFQGPPLRKAPLVYKPFLRKKRSFNRQRSQTTRTKPDINPQVSVPEGALQRVKVAENAANRALELAINLRARAQILMSNADLAVYKSVMALRIADSIAASDKCDLASLNLE